MRFGVQMSMTCHQVSDVMTPDVEVPTLLSGFVLLERVFDLTAVACSWQERVDTSQFKQRLPQHSLECCATAQRFVLLLECRQDQYFFSA